MHSILESGVKRDDAILRAQPLIPLDLCTHFRTVRAAPTTPSANAAYAAHMARAPPAADSRCIYHALFNGGAAQVELAPHISLTRTMTLRHSQVEGFVEGVRRSVADVGAFDVGLGDARMLHNEDRSRCFVSLGVDQGCDSVLRLIEAMDALVVRFDKQAFYQPPTPHVSIAWALREAPEEEEEEGTSDCSSRRDADARPSAAAVAAAAGVSGPPSFSPDPSLAAWRASTPSTLLGGGGVAAGGSSSSSSSYCVDTDSVASATEGASPRTRDGSPCFAGSAAAFSSRRDRTRTASSAGADAECPTGGRTSCYSSSSSSVDTALVGVVVDSGDTSQRRTMGQVAPAVTAAAVAATASAEAALGDHVFMGMGAAAAWVAAGGRADASAATSVAAKVISAALHDQQQHENQRFEGGSSGSGSGGSGSAAIIGSGSLPAVALLPFDARPPSRVSWRVVEACVVVGKRVLRFPLK